jgi:hypothetical protein
VREELPGPHVQESVLHVEFQMPFPRLRRWDAARVLVENLGGGGRGVDLDQFIRPPGQFMDGNEYPGAALVPFSASYLPIPFRKTVWGLLLAPSVTAILAVLFPVAVGLKVTVMVQLPPPARVFRLIGQVFV